MNDLLLKIKSRNKWWETGAVTDREKKLKREGYLKLIRPAFDNRKVLGIIGLRRTGKTTLVFQAIDHLLTQGTASEQILYVLMEDVADDVKTIDEVMSKYRDIADVNMDKETYIFIDEIHLMKNWQMQLKSYYESGKNIKFIVSSSSSTLLYKDAVESLVGRIQFISVAPAFSWRIP